MRSDNNISSLMSSSRPSGSHRHSQVRAWTIVALLALIFALAMTDRVILAVMIQPIKADLNLSDTAIGLAQGAAVALFYLIFAFPFGWASDRYDRRVILFCGITIWSLASAGCSLVTSFTGLFVARCLVGAGEAVLGPSGYPLIASLLPARRVALAMTLFYLGGTLGIALGQYAGGALLAGLPTVGHLEIWPFGALAPWRIVFLLTGLPGLVLAAFVFLAPRPDRATKSAAPMEGKPNAFRAYFASHRRFYLSHNLGFGLQQAALTGAMLWNSAFMARTYG